LGVSFYTYAENYSPAAIICMNKITEDSGKCLEIENKALEAFKEDRYVYSLSILNQFRQCAENMDTYIRQNKNCPENVKDFPKLALAVFTKRLTQTYIIVNLTCKRDYGEYAV
jgi:hypothetical protein